MCYILTKLIFHIQPSVMVDPAKSIGGHTPMAPFHPLPTHQPSLPAYTCLLPHLPIHHPTSRRSLLGCFYHKLMDCWPSARDTRAPWAPKLRWNSLDFWGPRVPRLLGPKESQPLGPHFISDLVAMKRDPLNPPLTAVYRNIIPLNL